MKKSNSVAVVEYKGTTKDVFEVGCTYKDIKVIARNGNKLTIQHLRSTIYHDEGDIENKRIYLAGGEDTNFTEYIKWNYGYEVCALNKVEEQPTTEMEKNLANQIINLIEIEKQENNNNVVSLVLKREDVNSMAHEMGMSKIMFVSHIEEYLKNHFEEKGIYVCWRFDGERNFEFQFIGKDALSESGRKHFRVA